RIAHLFHPERQELHDEHFSITVDDQPGKTVGLTVDEPERVRAVHHPFAVPQRALQKRAHERSIHRPVFACQKTYGDLRSRIPITAAEKPAAFGRDVDDGTRGGIRDFANLVLINPGMAYPQRALRRLL